MIRKTKLSMAIAALALTTATGFAYADQGGEGQNCEQGAQNQNFCGGQGGPGGDGGKGGNGGNATSTATIESGAVTNSVTGGNATIESGAVTNDFSGALSGNTLSGGNATIESGAVTNSVTGGNATIESGAVTNSVTGGTGGAATIESGAVTAIDASSHVVNPDFENIGNSYDNSLNIDDRDMNTDVRVDATDNSYDLNYNVNDVNVSTEGTVGDVHGGDASSVSSVGDTVSESNNTVTTDVNTSDVNTVAVDNSGSGNSANENSNATGDIDFDYSYSYVEAENVAASAASVFTSYCQNGASAQAPFGGFSVSNNDQFCDNIRMADYWWTQYQRQVQLSVTFRCDAEDRNEALAERCQMTGERMFTSLDAAWEMTEKANKLLENSELAANIERNVSPLAKIGSLLGVLVFLL